MKTYKGDITSILPRQVFVFGSNTQGRHGKGAAKWAKVNAGAEYGNPTGAQGQSYAIVTKDLTKKKHPSIAMDYIVSQIIGLYAYAGIKPELEFLIPYKSTGQNLSGYSNDDMAFMFACVKDIPENVIFEEGFAKMVQRHLQLNHGEQTIFHHRKYTL